MVKERYKAALCALLLAALPLGALAEGADTLLLTATVEPAVKTALKAPASGELAPFQLEPGDRVPAGEELFQVEPRRVYAQTGGTVATVFAQKGESADAAVARYGAVVQIEYEDRYVLRCTNDSGFNSEENRDLYVGAPVYLRSVDGKRFAGGMITQVEGREFTVAVEGGDLEYTQDVKVYRDPRYSARGLLARASLSTVPPYGVQAAGTVTEMAVQPGDRVQTGDLLFSYVPDALEPALCQGESPTAVLAGQELIVLSVAVQQGASVQKGQLLATVCAAGDYRLRAQVEEGDLRALNLGDEMTIAYEEAGVPGTTATVTAIGALGSEGDVSLYTVYLRPASTEGALPGMHATAEKLR